MRLVNEERGEVELVLRGEKAVICAEMARLAALSRAVGAQTLQELWQRLAGAEPNAMLAVLDTMVVEGSVRALRERLRTPADLGAVSGAVIKSLDALMAPDADQGNAGGAAG